MMQPAPPSPRLKAARIFFNPQESKGTFPMIQTRVDHQRGCGWRKEGALYLITAAVTASCGKLPVPLTVCPCCGHGIKQTRGWTWVDAGALLAGETCPRTADRCMQCPLAHLTGRHGLLWIGGQFYKDPATWLEETRTLGVSRRIKTVPHGFKLGETWILAAHLQGLPKEGGTEFDPAIVAVFKPTAIEYIVKGTETAEEIEALEKRGITPVKVERAAEVAV
jgi:ribosomal protein L32